MGYSRLLYIDFEYQSVVQPVDRFSIHGYATTRYLYPSKPVPQYAGADKLGLGCG